MDFTAPHLLLSWVSISQYGALVTDSGIAWIS